MPGEKIQIQWDDLKSRKVDQRLREQEALERNRRQADGQLLDDGSDESAVSTGRSSSIWYNTIFTMAVFGLLGGLLAWGAGERHRRRRAGLDRRGDRLALRRPPLHRPWRQRQRRR